MGAVLGGIGLTVVVAALAGLSLLQVVAVGAGAVIVFGLWAAFDYSPLNRRPGWPLAWMGIVVALLFCLSGSSDPIAGPLGSWYENLGFGFVSSVPVDQFVLGLAAGMFLTATTNRIVRLVLDAAVTKWETSETVLRGGRILGPLERLLVAAIVLAGDPAAGAIIVTAKGLLRFPEISGERGCPAAAGRGPDAVTEYFLIGTLTSLMVSVVLAVLVLAIN